MRLRAYLISGEFRVHRADCRDCQREARRSDSPGNAEEHASRADVIASLWSDIIAEDPELYGTPGGLAWKQKPSSCPAPAGCPKPARPGTAAGRTSAGSRPPLCLLPGRAAQPARRAARPALTQAGG